ncbi:hypothetical protein CR513_16508, partial [Mucuna pruriens]
MVNNVHSEVDRVRRKLPLITFTDQDFVGIDPKQNDPMVITIEVANFSIRKASIEHPRSHRLHAIPSHEFPSSDQQIMIVQAD